MQGTSGFVLRLLKVRESRQGLGDPREQAGIETERHGVQLNIEIKLLNIL